MISKKFMTKLLDDDYRKSILLKNDKLVNSPVLKLKEYATYVVDKHAKDRDETFKDDKDAGYGFCPFDVLMVLPDDGGDAKKIVFEFNIVNHFLVKNEHSKAVEVVECLLSEIAKAQKDVACFDIDKIEAEAKKAEEEYSRLHDEIEEMILKKIREEQGAVEEAGSDEAQKLDEAQEKSEDVEAGESK